MKKFISIIVAVVVMVIGCGAFAAESLPEFISEALGNDYLYFGRTSIVNEVIETEMPHNSASAICFKEGGYYFEYTDNLGYSYGWWDETTTYYDSMTSLSAMLATMYDGNCIELGVITNVEGMVYMLAPLEVNEYTFSDVYEFFDAVVDEIVFVN